jgi:hypothetical protein
VEARQKLRQDRDMPKNFVRRLLDRHGPTKGAPPTQETVVLATAAASLEILLRASRSCQIAPITPAARPSRDQVLALVYGSMSAVGIAAEAAQEGAFVSAKALSTGCTLTFLPTHPEAEQAAIGMQFAKGGAALMKESPAFITTVGRLAVVIVRETPATLPRDPLKFADGKPVDDMLAPLMNTLLNAKFDWPAG